MDNTPSPQVSARDYRRALGTYPTGVAVITAREEGGEPVGLVVGTFTSVSLEPRLVGFLPDRSSSSWPRIRKSGRFCVNVLNAEQEDVCRAFASKSPDRWERHVESETASGPRLRGVTLFMECDIVEVLAAGDHDMVLGAVSAMHVRDTGAMPLLFIRGGYGAPSVPFVQAETSGLVVQLRMADVIRHDIEGLAASLDLECRVTARDGDRIVIVAAAGIGTGARPARTTVGTTLPFIAPLAPLFIATASPDDQERWMRAGQEVFGDAIRPVAERLLADSASGVEEVSNRQLVGDLESLLEDERHEHHLTSTALEDLVRQFAEPTSDGAVSSMAVPVADPTGQVQLVLQLVGFSGSETAAELTTIRRHLQQTAASAASRLSRGAGGGAPA